jgi:hypothetical protein
MMRRQRHDADAAVTLRWPLMLQMLADIVIASATRSCR